jgi:hypothetical protein
MRQRFRIPPTENLLLIVLTILYSTNLRVKIVCKFWIAIRNVKNS